MAVVHPATEIVDDEERFRLALSLSEEHEDTLAGILTAYPLKLAGLKSPW